MNIQTGRFPNNFKCYRCKRVMDGFTGMSEHDYPQDGDIGICLVCSAVMQYVIDTTTDPATVSVVEASAELIAENTLEISKAQNTLRELRKSR